MMRAMAELKMDIAALDAFMAREFPQAARVAASVESLEPNAIRMRLPFHDDYLRPGGTLSGPTLMGLADRATYLLVLAMVGLVLALAVPNARRMLDRSRVTAACPRRMRRERFAAP